VQKYPDSGNQLHPSSSETHPFFKRAQREFRRKNSLSDFSHAQGIAIASDKCPDD